MTVNTKVNNQWEQTMTHHGEQIMDGAEIHIRPARPDDVDWITALVPRLHEFGPPPRRGVGRSLLAAAGRWAEEAGYPRRGSRCTSLKATTAPGAWTSRRATSSSGAARLHEEAHRA